MQPRLLSIRKIANIVFAAAVVVVVVWVVDILKNVLLPFCLACLIAYFMEPLVQLNRKWFKMKGRVLAAFLTILETTIVVGALVYFLVPSVVNEIDSMRQMYEKASASRDGLLRLPPALSEWVNHTFKTGGDGSMLQFKQIEQMLNSGASIVSESVGFLFHTLQWLIAFIYVIFILIDYPQLMSGFRKLVPPRYRTVAYKLFDDIKVNMNHYFRCQALIAACAAVFYCIGFSIVGIPLAIVLGLLVGVLYMIPYFQYVTLIPVAAVCLLSSLDGTASFWQLMGECLLVYVVSQSVCDYILTPKIMGKAMGLNPAIILLALSVWGTLMGLIGMIIALPLTTLLLSYYQTYVINRAPVQQAAAPDAPPAS